MGQGLRNSFLVCNSQLELLKPRPPVKRAEAIAAQTLEVNSSIRNNASGFAFKNGLIQRIQIITQLGHCVLEYHRHGGWAPAVPHLKIRQDNHSISLP
ncbi:hypothetical protein NXS19_013226 [Fusarium pseudograminearum]|nr:hypothetical protein NXS19_013226 [Fusarium pseudograminearum]